MIELVNVSKYYPTDFGRHYIFRDVSLALPIDKSVGVLGPNGAGKSTFLRLIGGADIPSEGKILRSGRISPPMGLTPGLQASLTGGENARFAGRIYGLQRDEIADLIDYVRELANIGKYFDMPVGTYSAGMRQRVSFAINMSMNFDYYLFDEIGAGGDKDFRKSAEIMVKERLKTSKFIIASHRTDELLDICDSGIVIQNGNLTFYDDIKDALAAYGGEDETPDRRARRSKRQADITGETPGLDPQAGPEAVEDAAGDTGGKRMTLRERRRLKLEEKMQQASADESLTAESEAPVTGTETAGTGEELQTLRERRLDLREQRRLRRELKEQQATADEPAAAIEPEVAAPEVEPVTTAEDRLALREQRRLRRELKKQQAASTETVAEEPAPPALETELPVEQNDRRTRREQRRLKREIEMAAASSEAAPESPPELPSTPAFSLSGPGAAPPVGQAPLAQRLRPRLLPEADEPRAGFTSAAPVSAPPLRPAGLKSLLIQRALLRQERARMTAARATKLLLQHLEDQSASGPAASQARAWLIGTAQQTAALDAAQVREMLDSISAYQLADPPQPVSTSHGFAVAPGESFSTVRTRSTFGRAAPSLPNPD